MVGATNTGTVRLLVLAVTAAVGANTDVSVGENDTSEPVKKLDSNVDTNLSMAEYAAVGGMTLKPFEKDVAGRRAVEEFSHEVKENNNSRQPNEVSGRKNKMKKSRRRRDLKSVNRILSSDRELFQSGIAADFVDNSASDSTMVMRSNSWSTGWDAGLDTSWYDPWYDSWGESGSAWWYEGSKSSKLTKSSRGADDWYNDGWAVHQWQGDDWLGWSGKSSKTRSDDWSNSWIGDDWHWNGHTDDWSTGNGAWLGSGKSGKIETDDWTGDNWTGDDWFGWSDHTVTDDWSNSWMGDDHYYDNDWDRGWDSSNGNIWRERKSRDWSNNRKRRDNNGNNGRNRGTDWGNWGRDRDRNRNRDPNNGQGKNNGGRWGSGNTYSPTFAPTLSPTFYPVSSDHLVRLLCITFLCC